MASDVFAVSITPRVTRPNPIPIIPRPFSLTSQRDQSASAVTIDAPAIMETMLNNAVYYPNYHLRQPYIRTPSALPGSKHISHVFYSHALVQMDGTVALSLPYEDTEMDVEGHRGGIAAVQALRAVNQYLKVLLCIGGGDPELRSAFASVASDVGKRRQFAISARRLVDAYGFNGIDIDWADLHEPQHGNSFLELLAEVRRQLPQNKYMVTTALTADPWIIHRLDLQTISYYVDFINLKAFDFGWPTAGRAVHCSQAYSENRHSASVDGAVQFFLSKQVPPEKINIGVPCFGRKFTGAKRIGDDFTFERDLEMHKLPYGHLVRLGEYDSSLGATWCVFDNGIVSYDNPDSIKPKGHIIKRRALAGFCFFDGPLDHADERRSVVKAGFLELYPSS